MDEKETKKYEVKIKKLPQSKIEITASISADEFASARTEAIAHISKDAELPGFRKGHVPEKMLLAKIGDAALLEEMAEIAISRAYPAIILSEKLDVLGRPSVRITKIAPGNPLEFTIETAVFPEIKLPDYKAVAKKTDKKDEAVTVTDEEMEKTINEVRKMHAPQFAHEHKEGEEHVEGEVRPEAPLPELTDEFVKTLGEFASVDDFKTKLRENLQKEKERDAKERRRIAIMDAIIDKATVELPEIVIEEEILRIEDEFASNIKQMGLDMEGYLKAVKKTREEMHREWRPDAEKRAKAQLLIGKIADAEKIEPDHTKLEEEIALIEKRFPDAPKERVRGYVAMVHTNQKVLEFLEGQE